jgi:hypothetical protein
MLWAANQLHFFVTPVVEVYSEVLLREIDPADPLRQYLEHMLGRHRSCVKSPSTCASWLKDPTRRPSARQNNSV